jgi:hypothetical protein
MRQAARIQSVGIVVASVAAFLWVASGAVEAADTLAKIRWTPFAAAVLLQMIALMFLMIVWERLLVVLSAGVSLTGGGAKHSLYSAYSRSWLARYIPGRIWALGGRMLLASRVGASGREVARSMAYEVLFSYGIVSIIGAALMVGARVHLVAGLAVFGVGMVTLAFGVPAIQRLLGRTSSDARPESLLSKLRNRAQRYIVGATYFSGMNILWAVGVYGIYSVFQLLFIILISGSFVDLSPHQMVVIAGAWGLSITVGWVSFLAPVGLGVRDGMAFVIFAEVLDAPTASLIVAASRVVMVAADMVFVGLVELVSLAMSSRQTQPQVSS